MAQSNQQGTSSDLAKNPASSVSVTTSSTTLVAANAARVEITICNMDVTNYVCLRLGASAAVLDEGIRINANGGSYTTNAYTGEIRAIAKTATCLVGISEI